MKAIELTAFEGFNGLKLLEVEKPKPRANQVLIEVKAAGINFADLELTKGRYKVPRQLPFIMGFEAAGVVIQVGVQVKNLKVGDKITSLVSSGGYAEYATADANAAISIPSGISFAEASSIPVQGLSAYALLKFAAKPQAKETVLVQAAAGGVGLYLVQLAKLIGVDKVIALAGSKEKIALVTSPEPATASALSIGELMETQTRLLIHPDSRVRSILNRFVLALDAKNKTKDWFEKINVRRCSKFTVARRLRRRYIVSCAGHSAESSPVESRSSTSRPWREPEGELRFRSRLAHHRQQRWCSPPARFQCLRPPAEVPRAEQPNARASRSIHGGHRESQ